MPFKINGIEVDIASPPPRTYRGAWVLEGEVVRIDPAKAAGIAVDRIKVAARQKRADLSRDKADANELKGVLALNARDDTKPAEREEARTLLAAYAAARGLADWSVAADQIIAARSAWTSRMMALETLEEAAWRALQAVTSADQVEQIERQIIEAIEGV